MAAHLITGDLIRRTGESIDSTNIGSEYDISPHKTNDRLTRKTNTTLFIKHPKKHNNARDEITRRCSCASHSSIPF